jgi:hypothetical protein
MVVIKKSFCKDLPDSVTGLCTKEVPFRMTADEVPAFPFVYTWQLGDLALYFFNKDNNNHASIIWSALHLNDIYIF